MAYENDLHPKAANPDEYREDVMMALYSFDEIWATRMFAPLPPLRLRKGKEVVDGEYCSDEERANVTMFIHKCLIFLPPCGTMDPAKLVNFAVGLETTSYNRRGSRLQYALLIEMVLNLAAFLIAFDYAFHIQLDLNLSLNEIEDMHFAMSDCSDSNDRGAESE